ncbi:17165_t:CDS:2, partial [Racocetra fulgida]
VATLTTIQAIGARNGGNQIGGLNTAGEFCNKARAEIDMGVEEFSTRIKKVGKLAGMTPEQQREQFIRSLNPINQYNIRMMAKFEDTQENITRALAEVEKFTLSQKNALSSLLVFLAANPYIDTNKSGMTRTEILDLIKTAMVPSESQTAQQNADLQSTIKSLQETMSRVTKTLDNNKKSSKKRAEDTAINRFL